MSISDEDNRLRELCADGICPNCGGRILPGTAVVRGAGAFCSLDCLALFSQSEFAERARLLRSAARN
jgi:hypothetical protein